MDGPVNYLTEYGSSSPQQQVPYLAVATLRGFDSFMPLVRSTLTEDDAPVLILLGLEEGA